MDGFPTHFHVGMVADLKAAVAEDVDMSEEKAVERAEETLWKARLQSFEAHFNKDLLLLKRAMQGHKVLQDKLSWISHTKRIQQVHVAQRLVGGHLEWFFPELSTDWGSLVGDLQQAMKKPMPILPPPQTGNAFAVDGSSTNLVLVRIDLNVPQARNALVVEKYAPLVATLARVHGAANFACLVVLASRPKEDSATDVLDDEVLITRKMSQNGLSVHLKLIQEMTPNQELSDANWLQKDTHCVYKLFLMHNSVKDAFENNRWCASAAVLNAKLSGGVWALIFYSLFPLFYATGVNHHLKINL